MGFALLGAALSLRAETSVSMQCLPPRQATANHARFKELQRHFSTGPEVTAACLGCHTEAAQQVMQTTHWTWRARANSHTGDTNRWIGKGAGVINNFCLAIDSNEPRCTSCHAGYGWEDRSFDFTDEQRVDCLVCHDTTGTYHKFPTDAGHPNYVVKEWPKGSGQQVPPPDLGHVARHVGRTSRATCGSCHFYGGGAEGVKHGMLDASLTTPDRAVDVHMDIHGANLSCTECHTTVNHQIAGRYYDHPACEDRRFVMRGMSQSVLGCESCHGAAPHAQAKLNDHTDKVSCQTCHIPQLAPSKPTKMWWDWSQAGRFDADQKPLVETARVAAPAATPDAETPKVVVYDGMKGEFLWAWKATPEYAWFNNHLRQTVAGEPIDDSRSGAQTGATRGAFDHFDLSKPVVRINELKGDYHDAQARIWPVKVHRGIQPYDPVNKLLIVPKLFPSGTNAGNAYWKAYRWPEAIRAGMEYAGLPYSGRYEWIQTTMHWPLSHMVAPKEQSLRCADCHHPTASRLAGLEGFYMPARDRSRVLDWLGWLLIGSTLGAVTVHGGLRYFCWRKRCSL
ncbi:MAG: tetrathionate reductase family octaheme c-type cytochrome [Verrucomicrobia bacterium]|nr:tetrathionate reductase family octaheme c-type cytochrome [Verrucomicrobiota bacterium]